MSKACPGRPNAYTVRRLRPLARLRLITRRPFFVDMRFKKPCFLARLILLGWYVRFIIHLQSVVMARPFFGWSGDTYKGTGICMVDSLSVGFW